MHYVLQNQVVRVLLKNKLQEMKRLFELSLSYVAECRGENNENILFIYKDGDYVFLSETERYQLENSFNKSKINLVTCFKCLKETEIFASIRGKQAETILNYCPECLIEIMYLEPVIITLECENCSNVVSFRVKENDKQICVKCKEKHEI